MLILELLVKCVLLMSMQRKVPSLRMHLDILAGAGMPDTARWHAWSLS